MPRFRATHLITVQSRSGRREDIPVQLIDGAAYTREEWDADANADWECDDAGTWTFQGRTTPRAWDTVSVRAVHA